MAAILNQHGRYLTSFSFVPLGEMGFCRRDKKFWMTILYLKIYTKPTKLLQKRFLDQRGYTLFQDGGHITLTWPMFVITVFSPVEEYDSTIVR